jgi:hypothetical protein
LKVLLLAVAICVLMLLFFPRFEDDMGWANCKAAYARATTKEDTLNVDEMRPPIHTRGNPRPLKCGALRRARDSSK